MGVRVIHVMTHDSIGLGEDGPTHQPVEHLAALRAMPNLLVFRPGRRGGDGGVLGVGAAAMPTSPEHSCADAPERCRRCALTHTDENLSAKGAYELAGADGAKVTFLATGSEVEIALKARDLLAAEDIAARVVSMPCWELFEEQTAAYREATLGPGTVKVAIEAAAASAGTAISDADGRFIGMHCFGASAPYKDLYKHFGITAEAAADAARAALSEQR